MSAVTVSVQSRKKGLFPSHTTNIFPWNSTCFDQKFIVFRYFDTEVLQTRQNTNKRIIYSYLQLFIAIYSYLQLFTAIYSYLQLFTAIYSYLQLFTIFTFLIFTFF